MALQVRMDNLGSLEHLELLVFPALQVTMEQMATLAHQDNKGSQVQLDQVVHKASQGKQGLMVKLGLRVQ